MKTRTNTSIIFLYSGGINYKTRVSIKFFNFIYLIKLFETPFC